MARRDEPTTLGEAFTKGYTDGLIFNGKVKERRAKIADNIRYLRVSNKETQQQVADSTEINKITYQGYESGRAEPSAEALVRLAAHFKVSVDYIVGYEPNKTIANDAEIDQRLKFVLNELSSRLDEEEKTIIKLREIIKKVID